ncbi:MAG: hypothetical protein ACK5U4_01580 [Rhodospirillales bacterium]|jgi:uncharacterized membrane protein
MSGAATPETQERDWQTRLAELQSAGKQLPADDQIKIIGATQTARGLDAITKATMGIYWVSFAVIVGLVVAETSDVAGAKAGMALALEGFKIVVLPILTLVIGLYTGQKMRND